MKCKKCGNEFTEKYSKWCSGDFCSRSCASSRIISNETRLKQSTTLKKRYETVDLIGPTKDKRYYQGKYYTNEQLLSFGVNKDLHTCLKCGKEFEGHLRNGKKSHCEKCRKRPSRRKKNPSSLFELSTRTVSKVLKRAKSKCSLCGWDKCMVDLHHIIPKSKGGSDEHSNLISVCPNCHREIHETKNYDIDILRNLSIQKTLPNWQEFYYDININNNRLIGLVDR